MTFKDGDNLQRAARIMLRAWTSTGTPAERLAHAETVARQLDDFTRGLSDASERVAIRQMAAPLQLLITILEADVEAPGGDPPNSHRLRRTGP